MVIGSKVEQLENMEVKLQRANEEAATFRKRIEKYKNRENATIADEVLLEEIKTYKVCNELMELLYFIIYRQSWIAHVAALGRRIQF